MNIIKLLRNYFLLLKSDFFDSKYYLKENPDVLKAKANPILHYLQFGWKEGRNPSSLFNTNDYIAFRPDILQADICPLVHYELFGKREFLSFCFDKIKYLENKISDLDVKTNNLDLKYGKKTAELDNKYGKKTTELDTKYGKKTTELDNKYGKKTAELDKFKNDVLYSFKRGINKEKVSCKIEKFLNSSELGITNEKREPELIVSLTSYPDRMYDIHYCIYSLLNQNLKPNKLILWLSEEQFPNREKDLPKKLLEFIKYGLTIKYTKDLSSYKKLIPALREYLNSIIVTVDDDLFYDETFLKKLYNTHLKAKKDIICHRGKKVEIENGKFVAYNSWKELQAVEAPSFFLSCLTGAGTLYPPNSLYKDVFEEKIFMNLVPHNDDIWFWAMAVLNYKKIINLFYQKLEI